MWSCGKVQKSRQRAPVLDQLCMRQIRLPLLSQMVLQATDQMRVNGQQAIHHSAVGVDVMDLANTPTLGVPQMQTNVRNAILMKVV